MMLSDIDVEEFTASLARDSIHIRNHIIEYGMLADNLAALTEARDALNDAIALIDMKKKAA